MRKQDIIYRDAAFLTLKSNENKAKGPRIISGGKLLNKTQIYTHNYK